VTKAASKRAPARTPARETTRKGGATRARQTAGSARKHTSPIVWRPYLLGGVLTLASYLAGRASWGGWTYGPWALAAVLLLTAVAVVRQHRTGQPIANVDRGQEAVFVSAVLGVAALWSLAVGLGMLWPVAVAALVAGVGGCAWWALRFRMHFGETYSVVIAAAAALGTGALSLSASPSAWWRWPAVAVALPTLAALPWWNHRGVRRGVNVDKAIGAWVLVASDIGHEVKAVGKDAMPSGWRARVKHLDGQTWERLAATTATQESRLGLRRGSITVEPDPGGDADMSVVQCAERDMHKDTQYWPGPTGVTASDPVTIGPRPDGAMAQILLWTREGARNLLIAGMRGAGKSTVINTIFAELAFRQDVVTVGIDQKGAGVEFGPWHERGALAGLATDLNQARAMFVALLAVTQARGEIIKTRGRKTWVPGPWWPHPERGWKDYDGPLLMGFDDEAHENLGMDPQVCADLMLRTTQLSRYAGVGWVLCTQRPSMKSIGDAGIRGQMDVTIALRFKRPADASFVLEGYEGYDLNPANPLWARRKGTCYVLGAEDERDTVTARAMTLKDANRDGVDEPDEVARARARLGVRLDAPTVTAALDWVDRVMAEYSAYSFAPRGGGSEAGQLALREVADAARRLLVQMGRPPADYDGDDAVHEPARPGGYDRPPARPVAGETDGPAIVPAPTEEEPVRPTPIAAVTPDGRLSDELAEELATVRLPGGIELPEQVGPRPNGWDIAADSVPKLSAARSREAILKLGARPDGVTRREVVDATNRSDSWVSDELRRKVEAGELTRQGPDGQEEFGRYWTVVDDHGRVGAGVHDRA
jgi:DNA translocase FtsK/SpoIIIE-like protein